MMADARAEKLADLVLDYSISLQRGDSLIIQFDPTYAEYATILGKKAREIGAKVRYDSISLDRKIMRGFIERYASEEWREELERRKEISSWCNARILVDCDSNPDYAAGIENSESRVADFNRKVLGPYKEVLYRPGSNNGYDVKWNIVGFPYEAGADAAGMTMEDYSDFVYAATLGNDWKKMSKDMVRIKEAFDNASDVHIIVPKLTDIHLSLEGRGGEIDDGRVNMPDGEICYGPVENSANGYIYFQCPTKREGSGILQGIRLEFDDGVVTDFSAKQNQKALEETLKIDDGARRVGELGIGCNYGIKRAVLETLFDEKIGGTIHLALGDSFREQPFSNGGGLNKSDIHWDIVCDLRKNEMNAAEYPGGEIYVDGKLVQKCGLWKI
jgi:aminopeptidase